MRRASPRIDPTNCAPPEAATYGGDHAMVGAYTLESWKLPASIVDALRHHHTNAFHVGAKLSRTIIAGEALARPAFDEPVFAHEPSASPNEAFRALGLRGASIDSLIARTAEESGLLDGLLGAR